MKAEFCTYHPETIAYRNLMYRPKKFMVCKDCFERFTALQPVCKHCGVRVKGLFDLRPKNRLYHPHGPKCPRKV